MLLYVMKRILVVILISIFTYSPSFAFTKGKGEVKMTERALDHFVNYVWGNFDVDLSKIEAWSSRQNNPKPLMFIMSSDGDWTTAWFCPYSRCSDPDSKQTIKIQTSNFFFKSSANFCSTRPVRDCCGKLF